MKSTLFTLFTLIVVGAIILSCVVWYATKERADCVGYCRPYIIFN